MVCGDLFSVTYIHRYTIFIVNWKEGNVLFNDALNNFF